MKKPLARSGWWPGIDKALDILVKSCQGYHEPAEAPPHP